MYKKKKSGQLSEKYDVSDKIEGKKMLISTTEMLELK